MNWETSNNLLSVVNTDKKEKSVILQAEIRINSRY